MDRSGVVSSEYSALDRSTNQADLALYSIMQSQSPVNQPDNAHYDHLNYGTTLGEYEKVDFPENQFAADVVL